MSKQSLTELYEIATNHALHLDVRYAAARQMQMEGNGPPKHYTKRYTEDEMNIIEWHGIREAARRLGRSEKAIEWKRYRMRRMRA